MLTGDERQEGAIIYEDRPFTLGGRKYTREGYAWQIRDAPATAASADSATSATALVGYVYVLVHGDKKHGEWPSCCVLACGYRDLLGAIERKTTKQYTAMGNSRSYIFIDERNHRLLGTTRSED